MVKREFDEMTASMDRNIAKNSDPIVIPVELIR